MAMRGRLPLGTSSWPERPGHAPARPGDHHALCPGSGAARTGLSSPACSPLCLHCGPDVAMEGARVTAASAGERLPGLQSIIFHGNQPINKPKNSNLFGKQDSAQPPCCLFWLGEWHTRSSRVTPGSPPPPRGITWCED